MIGKFFRWFGCKLNKHMSETENMKESAMKRAREGATVERSLSDHRSSMNLQIHSASGGYVLEFSKYDRKRDEHDRNLHIITEQQNLGEAIAQIITVEMLRH